MNDLNLDLARQLHRERERYVADLQQAQRRGATSGASGKRRTVASVLRRVAVLVASRRTPTPATEAAAPGTLGSPAA